jgi:hypothetical protein
MHDPWHSMRGAGYMTQPEDTIDREWVRNLMRQEVYEQYAKAHIRLPDQKIEQFEPPIKFQILHSGGPGVATDNS